MANPNKVTRVGVGESDGYRYIGIEPPLTSAEIQDLRDKYIIEDDWTITQIQDFEPAATLLTVSGDFDDDHPDTRTTQAQKVALDIAKRLGYLRTGGVSTNTSPIELQGKHSSPFNPNTTPPRTRF